MDRENAPAADALIFIHKQIGIAKFCDEWGMEGRSADFRRRVSSGLLAGGVKKGRELAD